MNVKLNHQVFSAINQLREAQKEAEKAGEDELALVLRSSANIVEVAQITANKNQKNRDEAEDLIPSDEVEDLIPFDEVEDLIPFDEVKEYDKFSKRQEDIFGKYHLDLDLSSKKRQENVFENYHLNSKDLF